MNGVSGGKLDHPYTWEGHLSFRRWNKTYLHGPLKQDDKQQIGYQYHLDSISKHTKTVVHIRQDSILYQCINLDSGYLEFEYK